MQRSMSSFPNRSPLTVSELNNQVKQLLEISFASVWVEGEISNFSAPGSGHWYFTLKDETAQVKCAMFRGKNLFIKPRPGNGDRILVCGKVSLYPGRGDYQLIVESLEAAGTGNLHRAFELLKAKLQAEGLFEQGRKRPLPNFPKHIGIITSPTGAAIHDILSVFRKRCPLIRLSLFPSLVQGSEAAANLCQRIKEANCHPSLDALILGRGGGSIEDLWPFNEEAVARAIAGSRLPIVSAVGHESDFTIADFVADYRAPTPSAAAELLSPDVIELAQKLDILEARLVRAQQQNINLLKASVTQLQFRLKSPSQHLQERKQYLNALRSDLRILLERKIAYQHQCLQSASRRILASSPDHRIEQSRHRISSLRNQLEKNMTEKIHVAGTRFTREAAKLDSLSPLGTIARGFAAVAMPTGKLIQSVVQARTGDKATIFLKDGALDATLTDVQPGRTIV